jgi:hypothetical protein
MFGIFNKKEITIPVDNAQTVTELESWTVEWTSYTNDGWSSYGNKKYNAKVFIIKKDVDEFMKQLDECAKFLNTTIHSSWKKN